MRNMSRTFTPAGNKKGFTLVELVVTLALLVLITGSIALLIQPAMRIYMDSVSLSRARRMGDDVSELFLSELLYAREIDPVTDFWTDGDLSGQGRSVHFLSPTYGYMTFSQDDGQLRIRPDRTTGEIGFTDDYFQNNIAKAGITLQGNLLTMEVIIYNPEGKILTDKKRTVKLLNYDPAALP